MGEDSWRAERLFLYIVIQHPGRLTQEIFREQSTTYLHQQWDRNCTFISKQGLVPAWTGETFQPLLWWLLLHLHHLKEHSAATFLNHFFFFSKYTKIHDKSFVSHRLAYLSMCRHAGRSLSCREKLLWNYPCSEYCLSKKL